MRQLEEAKSACLIISRAITKTNEMYKVLNFAVVGSVDLYWKVHVHLTFHKLKGMVNY